jgi:acetyl esterase/lipase
MRVVDHPEPGPATEVGTLDGSGPEAGGRPGVDPSDTPSRAPGRWVVLVVGALVVALMWVFVIAVVRPDRSTKVPLVNELVRETNIDALALALVAIVFGGWMLRRISRPLGAVVVASASIAVVTLVVPLVALARTAGDAGASLSLVDNVRHRGNSAVPDDSRGVAYTQIGGRSMLLDVWPAVAPANGAAVVWVHDGGWVSGIRSSTPRLDEWFNQHGYTVFDIDYRLAPQARNGDAVADVRCAVSWVKARAGRYGIDADRVILAGASAGGQLALSAAYDPTGPTSCATADAGDASVAAVMAMYPPTDLVSLYEADTNGGKMRDWLRRSLGGDPTQQPDAYRTASPVAQVHDGVPPTLLVHGAQDEAIPADQTQALGEALQRAGADHRALTLPFTDHAFDHSWNALGTQIARQAMVDFAGDHLRG